MSDLKNMAIYVGATLAVIAIILGLAKSGLVSGSAVGFIAIGLVVVLPIAVAVKLGKKEREKRQD